MTSLGPAVAGPSRSSKGSGRQVEPTWHVLAERSRQPVLVDVGLLDDEDVGIVRDRDSRILRPQTQREQAPAVVGLLDGPTAHQQASDDEGVLTLVGVEPCDDPTTDRELQLAIGVRPDHSRERIAGGEHDRQLVARIAIVGLDDPGDVFQCPGLGHLVPPIVEELANYIIISLFYQC